MISQLGEVRLGWWFRVVVGGSWWFGPVGAEAQQRLDPDDPEPAVEDRYLVRLGRVDLLGALRVRGDLRVVGCPMRGVMYRNLNVIASLACRERRGCG